VRGRGVLGNLHAGSCITPVHKSKGTLIIPCSAVVTGLDVVVLHILSVR
jgi:hypothetical protein